MEQEKNHRLPNWAVLLIAIIVGLLVYWVTRRDPPDIKAAEFGKKEIVHDIDSLTKDRESVIEKTVNKSQTQATKADGLIKTLPNEKPIIRDTTYSAMCRYITNYPGQP
jgi:hypothetical protein